MLDNVIAYQPSSGCPIGSYGCESTGDEKGCPNTCFCEDHCSWKKCRLDRPPPSCLGDDKHEWDFNGKTQYWRRVLNGTIFMLSE